MHGFFESLLYGPGTFVLSVYVYYGQKNILAKFEGIWSLDKFRQLIILSTTVFQHISYFSLFSFSNFSRRKNRRIKFFTPFDSAFNEVHLSLSFFHLISTWLPTVTGTFGQCNTRWVFYVFLALDYRILPSIQSANLLESFFHRILYKVDEYLNKYLVLNQFPAKILCHTSSGVA